MRHNNQLLTALALLITCGIFTTAAKADEWDKKTTFTINQAIQIQDAVLQPGSYVLKLVLPSERHLVQVLNQAETRVITTVFTVPAQKQEPAEDSEFEFYASETAEAPALHIWFYPGDATGFEFRQGHHTIATEAAQTVNATPSGTPGN
jgi:hypothetical protein